MTTQSIIYLLVILLVIVTSLCIYLLITRELQRRFMIQKERFQQLSKTQDGKEILEQETLKRNKQYERIAPFISIAYFICYLIFLCVGLSGVILFINDVISGKKVIDLIFLYKGYYLLSLFILIYSIFKIIKTIQTIKTNKNK